MTLLSARSIRIGTTILAAVSLAVSLVLATRAMASAPDADLVQRFVQGHVPDAAARLQP